MSPPNEPSPAQKFPPSSTPPISDNNPAPQDNGNGTLTTPPTDNQNSVISIPETDIPQETFHPLPQDSFGFPPQKLSPIISNSIGPQRVGVILYRKNSDPVSGRTAEEMARDIFDLSNHCSFNYFLMQASNGKTWLVESGVTPWLTIPDETVDYIAIGDSYLDYLTVDRVFVISTKNDQSEGGGPGNKQVLHTAEGDQQAIVTTAAYNVNYSSYSVCGEPGYSAYDDFFILAHEYGHSLANPSIDHAGLLYCGSEILKLNQNQLDSSCTEQVDPLDQLGQGIRQYNALIKEKLGWLDDSQIGVVKHSGIYAIHPVEVWWREPSARFSGQMNRHTLLFFVILSFFFCKDPWRRAFG